VPAKISKWLGPFDPSMAEWVAAAIDDRFGVCPRSRPVVRHTDTIAAESGSTGSRRRLWRRERSDVAPASIPALPASASLRRSAGRRCAPDHRHQPADCRTDTRPIRPQLATSAEASPHASCARRSTAATAAPPCHRTSAKPAAGPNSCGLDSAIPTERRDGDISMRGISVLIVATVPDHGFCPLTTSLLQKNSKIAPFGGNRHK
jgi:hypothetical protein